MRKIYNYGQIIRAKRQNKNIKAINLAKDLGITPAYLSLIESNQRKPDGDLLLRIQDLLDLQNQDLTKRTDPDLETRTQEVVKISLLEDLDIRTDEVQEIVRLNPKIAKALVKLGIDHKILTWNEKKPKNSLLCFLGVSDPINDLLHDWFGPIINPIKNPENQNKGLE